METPRQAPSDAANRAGFALRLRGANLELVVAAPKPGSEVANKADILAAINDFPVNGCSPEPILEAIQRHDGRAVTIGVVAPPADGADWDVKLSPNRIAAYLVPRPPDSGGSDTSDVAVREDDIVDELRVLGVTHGIMGDVVASLAASGVHGTTEIARGQRPGASQNARIEFTFQQGLTHTPVQRSDGSIDFHAGGGNLGVEEGTVLARRIPPVQGEPGRDVLGNELPAPRADDKTIGIYAGKGTEVQGDLLIATRAGKATLVGAKVEVLPVLEIKGDVNYAVGNISFNGDVVIGGDVQPGFVVEAEGSVTIRGIVDRANITAGRDITATGIAGDGQTRITAGGNMQAQYVHKVHLTVKGSLVINRELVGCIVMAAKVQTSPNGRIVGGEVTATDEISAGTLGSPQAVPTAVTVLSGDAKHPAVIRATRTVHAATWVKVRHSAQNVMDDLPGSSFWEFEGELWRLGPAASAPQPKPGNTQRLVA